MLVQEMVMEREVFLHLDFHFCDGKVKDRLGQKLDEMESDLVGLVSEL